MRVYFHTLLVTSSDLNELEVPAVTQLNISKIRVRPLLLHPATASGTLSCASLELALHLPPLSRNTITIDFERVFTHVTLYPSDPYRGISLPPSVLSFIHPSLEISEGRGEGKVSCICDDFLEICKPCVALAYSDILAIELPLPDFSMPYNVLALTGTVFLLIGVSFLKICFKNVEIFPSKVKPE